MFQPSNIYELVKSCSCHSGHMFLNVKSQSITSLKFDPVGHGVGELDALQAIG